MQWNYWNYVREREWKKRGMNYLHQLITSTVWVCFDFIPNYNWKKWFIAQYKMGTFHLCFLLICRKSVHWIAFTGWNTFVHFTCGRSTRGASLVQCITFGNCTLCTTSLGRCKSSAIQYNRGTEAHRLVESSCWKRTGNLFGHKTSSNNEKKTQFNIQKIGHNRASIICNGCEFHVSCLQFF